VVKPNAVGALQRLGLNFCGGQALGDSARSVRWHEYTIQALSPGKTVMSSGAPIE
jgi:hypothetical protein